jgi:Lrp/AsnC family transcriptional regulator, leucine-responsive regulatory protein
MTAFIQVRLERQVQNSLENFTRAIDRIGQVMECYLMTGESDYMLRVVARDIEELEDIIVNKLSRIPGVFSMKSNLALKKISHKTVLPIEAAGPVQINRANSGRGIAGEPRRRSTKPPICLQANNL